LGETEKVVGGARKLWVISKKTLPKSYTKKDRRLRLKAQKKMGVGRDKFLVKCANEHLHRKKKMKGKRKEWGGTGCARSVYIANQG